MGIQESTLNSWISCLSLCGAWGNYLGVHCDCTRNQYFLGARLKITKSNRLQIIDSRSSNVRQWICHKHIILWDYLELAMTPFSMYKCTNFFCINLIYHLETYKIKQIVTHCMAYFSMNPLIDVNCSLNLKFYHSMFQHCHVPFKSFMSTLQNPRSSYCAIRSNMFILFNSMKCLIFVIALLIDAFLGSWVMCKICCLCCIIELYIKSPSRIMFIDFLNKTPKIR